MSLKQPLLREDTPPGVSNGGVPAGFSGGAPGGFNGAPSVPLAPSSFPTAPPPQDENNELVPESVRMHDSDELHETFERGRVETRPPDGERMLNSQTGDTTCISYIGAAALACTGVGLLVLLGKTKLVEQGEIALCKRIDGSVRILSPGWHCASVLGCEVGRYHQSQDIIEFGSSHIILVRPGFYGLATQNGQPMVLEPGRHVITNPLFSFQKMASMNEAVINQGTIFIITVPANAIGLCLCEGEGFFLPPGRHFINRPRFVYRGSVLLTEEHIEAGTKHRVTVPAGKIGLGLLRGFPKLLEPGRTYNIDSAYFEYLGSKSVMDEVIMHGSIKIIIVRDGKLGISYDEGVLIVLKPGRHVLDKPTHMFGGFISGGQQTLTISKLTSMTCDNVGVCFDAAITIQIKEAKKAVMMLAATNTGLGFSEQELLRSITEKAKLSMSIIVGNNRINDAMSSTTIERQADVHGNQPAFNPNVVPEAKPPSFKQHIHDIFMKSFADQMLLDCGVAVVDMSIEDIQITNQQLAQSMALGAVARVDLEKSRIEADVQKMQARALQESEVIEAEGRAKAMAIMAKAEAERIAQLDEAMSKVCAVTQQRELIRASAEVLSSAGATMVFSSGVQDMTSILGGGNGMLSQALQKK